MCECNAGDLNTQRLTCFKAGGMAGTSVDILFFPLDTLKTRLQAPQGFVKAGGLHQGHFNANPYNYLEVSSVFLSAPCVLNLLVGKCLRPCVRETGVVDWP